MHVHSQHNTFFWLRNFLILGQVIVWLMARYIWEIDYPVSVLILSGIYFVVNFVYWLGNKRPSDREIFIHLFIDIIELSIFFYLTGGASNPFTWFLLIPIIFSATVLKQKHTWILTAVSILSYTLLIKFFQPVESSMDMSMMNHQNHTTSFGQHLIGMWLGFIVIALIIAWVIIGLLKNIRQKEELLMQAHLKQADNNKMMALATLATGSAHELGTPLATINIITKELLNNPKLNPYHPSLAIVESQVYRCKDLLTEITAATGTTQAIRGSVVTVAELLKEITSQITVPKSIQFNPSTHINPVGKLLTDKTLIQALVNILNNALESQATQVSLSAQAKDHILSIIIEDDGEGLEPGFLKNAESEKDFGMGLGLFLAKATIQRFSGNIILANKQEQGTKMLITLPLNHHE